MSDETDPTESELNLASINKYATRGDEDLNSRAQLKEMQLRIIFAAHPYKTSSNQVKVAVLGCPDRRMIPTYQTTFERLLDKNVALTILEISPDHLMPDNQVIKHDVTTPFPGSPYDIVFSHVLLKFINRQKHWDVIKNSYEALNSPGLAIHIFDKEEITARTERISRGYYAVSLPDLRHRLRAVGIKLRESDWESGVPERRQVRGLQGHALILIK